MSARLIYQFALAPGAILGVEESGNIVLQTPERRITITNVAEWINQLEIARMVVHPLEGE